MTKALELPKVALSGVVYYVDARLNELRNVNNHSDKKTFSQLTYDDQQVLIELIKAGKIKSIR